MIVPVAVGVTTFEVEPRTEPTLLSMLRVVGVPPDKVQDKVTEFPEMIVAGDAVNVEITGAAGAELTVILTDFVAVPPLFFAVSVYVIVAVGLTTFEVKPNTEPTLLLIESVVGVPPESVQERVAELP